MALVNMNFTMGKGANATPMILAWAHRSGSGTGSIIYDTYDENYVQLSKTEVSGNHTITCTFIQECRGYIVCGRDKELTAGSSISLFLLYDGANDYVNNVYTFEVTSLDENAFVTLSFGAATNCDFGIFSMFDDPMEKFPVARYLDASSSVSTTTSTYSFNDMVGQKLLILLFYHAGSAKAYDTLDGATCTGGTLTKLCNLKDANATAYGTFYNLTVDSSSCTVTSPAACLMRSFEASSI